VRGSLHRVSWWAGDAGHARSIATERRNARYLAEIPLPSALVVTPDFGAATLGAALLLVATPVSGLRAVAGRLAAASATAPLVWLCKGFEQDTGLLPHQVVAAELGSGYPCAA